MNKYRIRMSVLKYRLYSEKLKNDFKDILKSNNARTELDLPYLQMVIFCDQDISVPICDLLKISPQSIKSYE
jgi:hypothetical protein